MPTEPPPGRYRVVEKGRRLVVIDTRTGLPAGQAGGTAAPAARPPSRIGQSASSPTSLTATRPAPPAAPGRAAFDGRMTLVTKSLYDLKAPRTLHLDAEAARQMESARSIAIGAVVVWCVIAIFMPWVLLPLLFLLNPKARGQMREAATRWLDRYDPDVASGG